jgi:endonuclease/exonuclease/phosphatase family metal-dependent hydrolase
MQWNVNDSVREEQYDYSRWAVRKDRILALIKLYNPDTLSLQEITQRDHRTQFIMDLSLMGYDTVFGCRNASRGCTTNLIAWKQTKYYHCSTRNVQLLRDHKIDSTVPDDITNDKGWGANLLLTELLECCNEKIIMPPRRVIIGSVHFPVLLESRIKCMDAVIEEIKSLNMPFIISGDLNTFGDKGGPEEIAKLQSEVEHLGGKVVGSESISDQSGQCVKGTFFGFKHDRVTFQLGNDLDPLDHIILSHHLCNVSVTSSSRTMYSSEPEEWSTTELPSDHLPLIVKIKR